MGPLVLCCFFVAVKIGSSFMREGADEPEMLKGRRHLSTSQQQQNPPDRSKDQLGTSFISTSNSVTPK
jgi:hypothetical protein